MEPSVALSGARYVALPFVLLLLDYWPLGRMASNGSQPDHQSVPTRLVLEKIPMLALAAASCALTVWAQSKAIVSDEQLPLLMRMANAVVSYAAYLVKLICPVDLAALYPYVGFAPPAWEITGSILALMTLSIVAFAWRRRHPYFWIGWLWYLGMLVPVIGLIPVGTQAMADRYTYLPQIGLGIALAWGTAELCRAWSSIRWVCGIASVSALLVLMGCAWHQTSFWRDSETLWNHVLECGSRNKVAEYDRDNYPAGHGRASEAMAYQNVFGPNFAFAEAHCGLGAALASRGRLPEAVAHFQKALEIYPDYEKAHYDLGVALAKLGLWNEAVAHFQKALEIDPGSEKTHYDLGVALARLGLWNEAVAHFQKALEINPNYGEAHNNFGVTLIYLGRLDEANVHFQKAIEINPENVEAHNNFGNSLVSQGRLDEAVAQYRKALEIKPDYTVAQNSLAWQLATAPKASLRNGIEAVELAGRANRFYGGTHPEVLETLAAAYAETGRFPEALATARDALNIAVQHDQALAEALRDQIAQYEAGKPFRQPSFNSENSVKP